MQSDSRGLQQQFRPRRGTSVELHSTAVRCTVRLVRPSTFDRVVVATSCGCTAQAGASDLPASAASKGEASAGVEQLPATATPVLCNCLQLQRRCCSSCPSRWHMQALRCVRAGVRTFSSTHLFRLQHLQLGNPFVKPSVRCKLRFNTIRLALVARELNHVC